MSTDPSAEERHRDAMRAVSSIVDVDAIAARTAGGSRFALATVVTLRARQLGVPSDGEKPVTVALEEAASGQLAPLQQPTDPAPYTYRNRHPDAVPPYYSAKPEDDQSNPRRGQRGKLARTAASELRIGTVTFADWDGTGTPGAATREAPAATVAKAAGSPTIPDPPFPIRESAGAKVRTATYDCKLCGRPVRAVKVSPGLLGRPPTVCSTCGMPPTWVESSAA